MISISFLIVMTVISMSHGRAVNSRSVPMTVDSYGNRVFLIRDQRNPIYPQRSMMITGMYQPMRRASSRQATGVFAQGNAVTSDAYLDTNVRKYYRQNAESIDEPEISSAEAEAYDTPIIDEKPNDPEVEDEDNVVHDNKNIQPQQEEESPQYSTEIPAIEEPIVPQTEITQHPTKTNKPTNKTKKTKIHVDEAEEDDGDDDDDDDEDEDDVAPASPFIPFKVNRRNGMSALNNFFPMVFSFPKSYGRRSSSGSTPPGMITAIANSYSTGKGGVASSVATAYGSTPNSKKKLQKSQE